MDEYLAMDQELETDQPCRAPDTMVYTLDSDDHDHEPEQDETPPLKPEEALNYLQHIQKSNLGDTKLFYILEHVMNLIQYNKTVTKLTSKTKQSSIKKFLF